MSLEVPGKMEGVLEIKKCVVSDHRMENLSLSFH